MIELSPALVREVPKNGPTDPIEYYRRPLVGRLFRERINRGLRMLPERRFAKALEVGYGAGAVQLALSGSVDDLHGIDLDADPAIVAGILAAKGRTATLVRGSVLELPYADATFDLVACFSVFEHLTEYRRALAEVARVMKPGGLFLLGMPSVNLMMEAGFQLIGFKGISDHHVTTPEEVSRAFASAGLRVAKSAFLDVPAARPFGLRLYHNWLLEKGARG
ncbi:MAG: methyltransferase domain-containing protein [Minicystis sp.]